MRFLLDENLPPLLAAKLTEWGHDAIHVFDTPGGASSDDPDVASAADAGARTVVSRDKDFPASHRERGVPTVLLHLSIPNMKRRPLIALFERHLPEILARLEQDRFAELGEHGLAAPVLHRPTERPPAPPPTDEDVDPGGAPD